MGLLNPVLQPMAPDHQAVPDEKDSSLVQATELSTQRQSETSNDTIAVNTDGIGPDKEPLQVDPIVILPPVHSVYTSWEKRLIVISAAFSGLFASWTAQIYLPALNNAARDLHTSTKKINLTVTSYTSEQSNQYVESEHTSNF